MIGTPFRWHVGTSHNSANIYTSLKNAWGCFQDRDGESVASSKNARETEAFFEIVHDYGGAYSCK